MENSLRYAHEKADDFENEFIEFLKNPSVSAEPEYRNQET